ncbi:MAG TPA: helix-turn-helix transcriptional regulator [bacterium]|nr:helix-turn-helix transcriptional regulator [bacterium]
METLGQFLKREREFRGITIDRLASMTRINSGVLKKIEGDDLRPPLQPVYIKSFLKSYAGSIGLDPRDVLMKYEGQAATDRPPAPVPVESEPSKGGFPWFGLVAAVAVTASIALAVFLVKR